MELLQLQKPQLAREVDIQAPIVYHKDFEKAISTNCKLKVLYDQCIWAEGCVWWENKQMLVWSDVKNRRVLGWSNNGAVKTLIDPTDFINGNTIGVDGNLYHCDHGNRSISSTIDGKTTVLIDRFEGKRLNSPNDITTTNTGDLWFTDPTFGIEKAQEGAPRKQELTFTGLYKFNLKINKLQLMARLLQPNGLDFNKQESILYVTQTPEDGSKGKGIYAYDWNGETLENKRFFADVETGIADGIYVDKRGWLWSSSKLGIQVFNTKGKTIGLIPTPHLITNCVMDKEEKRLFAVGGKSAFMIELIS